MSISPRYHDLVSLFPRFLRLQPFGWKGSQDILQYGLQLTALLLLRGIVQETDSGEMLSRQEMETRVFNPYSTFRPIFDNLPSLLEQGYMSHSWGGYHWARTANPFTVKLGNNVSGVAWTSALNAASSDWSASDVLNTTVVTGLANPKNCRGTTGRVEVCNSTYGNNG